MDDNVAESSLPMISDGQGSNDIPLSDIVNVCDNKDGMKEPQMSTHCNSVKPESNPELEQTMLAKHLFHVHASHCEGCQFINNRATDGHDGNDGYGRKYAKKDDGRVHNGHGPVGSVSQKTDSRYTEAATTVRYQPRKKTIPAPISMPSDSSQTTSTNAFDYANNSSSTPRSVDSSDPGHDDCQRMIRTPPPAVLHHDWKTEVIFPHQQTDCNNKVAVGVTVFMVLALFLGIIAFMVVFFATRVDVADRTNIYETVSVSVVLKVNLTYKESYMKSSSQDYKEFSADIKQMMDSIFMSSELSDIYLKTVINGFRPGSVYIDTIVLLSTYPVSVSNKNGEYSETSTKDRTKQLVFDTIRLGVKDNAAMILYRMKLEALYVTNVLLDSSSLIVPPQSSFTGSLSATGDIHKGTTINPTDALFVDVKYHELLNQEQCGTRRLAMTRFRIIGGHPAPANHWPWIGSMDYAVVGHKCAASLIAPQWAITAAHCVTLGRDAILQNITFGDISLNTKSAHRQEIAVARIYSHPGFSMLNMDHDIAVLKLAAPVKLSSGHVRPVCLETDDIDWRHNIHCLIAGWGVTDSDSLNISTELQEAEVPLVTKLECSDQYHREGLPSLATITDNMMCAGTEDGSIDSCQSDSGGPLVCQKENGKWHLVGVTSFGYGCGNPDFSGVYANVSRYWEWVTSVIDEEPTLRCEPINLEVCQSVLPYSHTYVTSQSDYIVVFDRLLDNYTYTSQYKGKITFADYILLLCAMFLPRCHNDINQNVAFTQWSNLVPCRQFCKDVEAFVEANHLPRSYVFYLCPSYPTTLNASTQLCETTERSLACDTNAYINASMQLFGHLLSPNYPNAYDISSDCSWFISAPENSFILIKIRRLQMPVFGDILRIGEGFDVFERTTVRWVLRGDSVARPMIVRSNKAWARLQSDDDAAKGAGEYFSIEFHSLLPADASTVCRNGMFDYMAPHSSGYPIWWQCDGIVDCDNSEDEQNCDNTSSTTISSSTIMVNSSAAVADDTHISDDNVG